MTQVEFLWWIQFFTLHPTLLSHLLSAEPAIEVAPPSEGDPHAWTAADLATFKAMGMKPPRKV